MRFWIEREKQAPKNNPARKKKIYETAYIAVGIIVIAGVLGLSFISDNSQVAQLRSKLTGSLTQTELTEREALDQLFAATADNTEGEENTDSTEEATEDETTPTEPEQDEQSPDSQPATPISNDDLDSVSATDDADDTQEVSSDVSLEVLDASFSCDLASGTLIGNLDVRNNGERHTATDIYTQNTEQPPRTGEEYIVSGTILNSPELAPGERKIIQVQFVLVADYAGETIGDKWMLRSNNENPNKPAQGNFYVVTNEGPCGLEEEPEETYVDMVIEKTVAGGQYMPGGYIDYALNYRNAGTERAEDVVIIDTLHSSYANPLNVGDGVIDGQKISWSVGSLAPGETGVINYRCGVAVNLPAGETLINNTATIATTSPEEDLSQNTAEQEVSIYSEPDLVLSLEPQFQTLETGAYLYLSATVKNAGTSAATAVNFTLTGLRDIEYKTDTSGVTPIRAGMDLAWLFGTLAPAEQLTFTIQFNTPSSLAVSELQVPLLGLVTTSAPELNTDNNTKTSQVKLTTTPDLQLSKQVTALSEATNKYRYDITVRNVGNGPALEMEILDQIEDTYIEEIAAIEGVQIEDNEIIWNVGTLLPNQEVALTYTLTIANNLTPGTYALINIAETNFLGDDPTPDNNTDSASIDVEIKPAEIVPFDITDDDDIDPTTPTIIKDDNDDDTKPTLVGVIDDIQSRKYAAQMDRDVLRQGYLVAFSMLTVMLLAGAGLLFLLWMRSRILIYDADPATATSTKFLDKVYNKFTNNRQIRWTYRLITRNKKANLLEVIKRRQPDEVVYNVGMHPKYFDADLDLLQKIKQEYPKIAVTVLYPEQQHISKPFIDKMLGRKYIDEYLYVKRSDSLKEAYEAITNNVKKATAKRRRSQFIKRLQTIFAFN